MQIREAQIRDASDLLQIYSPYVLETAITFETAVPTIAEFQERMMGIMQYYPYLVAEENGRILGYAYAHEYYGRAAYDWTVEVSIYVDQQVRQSGIGTLLYDALEAMLDERHYVSLLACISLPNTASISFHEKRGYKQVAHFDRLGFKFDRWYDIVWLQKRLKEIDRPNPLIGKHS
ncbi:N-acetyltransferase family protein [Streptococcus cameli]